MVSEGVHSPTESPTRTTTPSSPFTIHENPIPMATEIQTHQLYELPPSAKLVYKTLDYEGPQTQSSLTESTKLSDRTARYALKELKNAGLVTEEICFRDARKRLYRLQPDDTDA